MIYVQITRRSMACVVQMQVNPQIKHDFGKVVYGKEQMLLKLYDRGFLKRIISIMRSQHEFPSSVLQ